MSFLSKLYICSSTFIHFQLIIFGMNIIYWSKYEYKYGDI